MLGYWHTEKDDDAPARIPQPEAKPVYSDDPTWQLKPLSLDFGDPLVRRFLWYRNLTAEQRARVDNGLPPDKPAPAKRPRKPLPAE